MSPLRNWAGPILDSEGMGVFLGEHFQKKEHFAC